MPAVNLTGAPDFTAMINGGASSTSDPLVTLTLFSNDRNAGTKSMDTMLIFGTGVDPKCDPAVGTLSTDGFAIPFQASYPVVLSAGAGSKSISVSAINRERNSTTKVLTIAYTVNTDAPIVTMVGSQPDLLRDHRIASGLARIEFDYRIDQACNEIRVALVPTSASPITDATTVKTFTGTYTAGQFFSAVGATPSMGYVTYAEILAVNGGSTTGPAFVKVFAKRTSDGVWSL